MTLTPAGTLLVANDIARDDPEFSRLNLILCNSPVILVSTLAMLIHAIAHFGGGEALLAKGVLNAPTYSFLQSLLPLLWTYNATVNFPNVLRQSCLVLVSTYCHYYGDIPERVGPPTFPLVSYWPPRTTHRCIQQHIPSTVSSSTQSNPPTHPLHPNTQDVFFQTQILDHWLLYPFQLFCFNFGATHIMHHFVTRQPFYLRQVAVSLSTDSPIHPPTHPPTHVFI